MNSEAIAVITAATVALTQLLKWAGLPDKAGPLAVLALSAAGVLLWAFSQIEMPWGRGIVWPLFNGWILVALSAAGTFGFTRAAASAVISAKPPPAGGAGSSPTV